MSEDTPAQKTIAPATTEAKKAPEVPNVEPEAEAPRPDRLAMLKQRADTMGITYSNNIGVDALAQKIQDKLNNKPEAKNDEEVEERVTKQSIRQQAYQDAMRLVRLRIANLDPAKGDLPGEIFTVSNNFVGTVRKFVPFGEATDEGWHVPNIIYQYMKERQFLQIRTVRDPVTKRERIVEQWVKEFSLEELPPLTEEELAQLAVRQAAAQGL